MKITMYELLGLVKDGKAPKKIKTDTGIFKLEIEDDELHYRCNDGGILIFDYYIENNKLSNEVEIIEEPKKIEKITWSEKESLAGEFTSSEKQNILARRTEKLKSSLNELIDEINNLKEND